MTGTEAPTPAEEAPQEHAAEVTPEAEAPAEEAAAQEPGEVAAEHQDWWERHYTFTGTAVGLVFLWLSMTPSLLPRGPLFQGLVSGAAGAIGYAIGVLAVWLVRFMLSKDSSPRAPRAAWLTLVVLGIVGTIGMIIWFHVWQDHVRDLIGVPRLTWHDYPVAAILAIVVLFVFVEIGQLVGRFIRFLVRQLNRVAPPRVSAVVAVLLVVGLVVAILNGVVLRVGMRALNNVFEGVNNEMSTDRPAPTSTLRSGGPGSLVKWAELGNQGRTFVDSGPTVAQLSKFNGAGAVEPIRAYAGIESADDIKANAELAARELERTGGLTRKVVAVATTTGTGWINEAEADAIEYMFNGDTAIVSMQYSFLPSWLSFLVDKENARHAGQALFEAVSARVRALPEGQRPKLVVFGESLGSFGGEAPFLSVNNIVARTDGALFSGPTFNNTMWLDATEARDKGSPEWLPIYQDGQNVRFSATAQNLGRPPAPWGNPRIVYLQHASDPITWWNPELVFSEPDWLREAPGYDRPRDMFWFPVVTFLQVSADMAVAVDVPDGHGHRYVRDVVNAWADILQPPGWTEQKTAQLRELVNAPE
ncbi:MAG: alpha/beta-hydrolase family protein [Mycobacteriaceae bacterium]|nr:alpha/beta-hydrolase family protein [Mycobacteriaceae bacterium]